MGVPTIIRANTDAGDVVLADGSVLIGNSSGVAQARTMSGDATISNSGALTIAANAVESSMLETPLLQYQDTQIADAAIKTLLTTDVVLVTNPGANKAAILHAAYLFFDVTTTGYTITSTAMAIGYGTDGADILAITEAGFIDQTSDQTRVYYIGGAAATPVIVTPTANKDLVLRVTGANVASGNTANTLSVRVWYSVVDVAAFT